MISQKAIFEKAILNKNQTTVVTCPYDNETIEAVIDAIKFDLCSFIFVGQANKINEVITSTELTKNNIKVVDADNDIDAAKKTMQLLKSKEANVLMKGLIDTSVLLKELLKRENELRTNRLLSHVGLLTKDGKKSYFVTDPALNIAPSLEQKVDIINNAVLVANELGLEKPVVANLCAKEKVYDKMPATLDAKKLQEMNQEGLIKNCLVSGPLQLDNAVSVEACKTKGVSDLAGGKADIFMCPFIEVGNALAKGMKYLAGYEFSGVVVGAKIPIVLVSRADNANEKLLSIAMANCIPVYE
ncbi:MAG: phosphate acyltransferase [Bacilli bacterium]